MQIDGRTGKTWRYFSVDGDFARDSRDSGNSRISCSPGIIAPDRVDIQRWR